MSEFAAEIAAIRNAERALDLAKEQLQEAARATAKFSVGQIVIAKDWNKPKRVCIRSMRADVMFNGVGARITYYGVPLKKDGKDSSVGRFWFRSSDVVEPKEAE